MIAEPLPEEAQNVVAMSVEEVTVKGIKGRRIARLISKFAYWKVNRLLVTLPITDKCLLVHSYHNVREKQF